MFRARNNNGVHTRSDSSRGAARRYRVKDMTSTNAMCDGNPGCKYSQFYAVVRTASQMSSSETSSRARTKREEGAGQRRVTHGLRKENDD